MKKNFYSVKQTYILFTFLLTIFSFGFAGCSDKEEVLPVPPPEISGIESEYTMLEGTELQLSPVITNGNEAVYIWLLDGNEVAATVKYIFRPSSPGTYRLKFKAKNEGGEAIKEIIVSVVAKGEPPVITRLEDKYTITVETELKLSPVVISDTEITYSWIMDEKEVATTAEYLFNTSLPGKYTLLLKVINQGGITEKTVSVHVNPKLKTVDTEIYTILPLAIPDYIGEEMEVTWKVVKAPTELYRLSYTDTKQPLFVTTKEGEYNLIVSDGEIESEIKIVVKKKTAKLSAYIAKVFDYLPAPGQFVNKLPQYQEGDTHEDMVRKANEWLVGEDAWMITLGGWGGYVTIGFDHTIVNVPDKKDFRINGNAFGSAMGRPNAPFGGSCEPGIIMVAYDKNKNGRPDDDEWYEIKGSSNFSAEKELWYSFAQENSNDTRVFRDYQMTYYKPEKEEPEIAGEPDNPLAFITIKNYIRWEDNKNNNGYKVKNVYHQQTYYPAWVKENQLTFKGIRLPENGINEGKFVPGINEGNIYFVLYGFGYGYVDNHPNVQDGSAIDIDWAIDKEGNKADLPGIDFVKIYNGVNQENGWIGESSTEVERGEDLHMLGKNIETIKE